jgi:hypothetical protein
LEERVLLNGIPLAVIASLPRFTESHSGSTGEITVGTTGTFTLPKFDDRGGIMQIMNGGRVLVGVTLDSATSVIEGTRLAENTSDFAGILSVLTLTLTVQSNVFVVIPHVTPEFNFQLVTSASLQDDPNYETLKNIGAKDILDWLPTIKAGQTYPDLRSVTLAGMTSGPQQEKLSYPTDPLDDFIISGSDSTILFETTGATATSLTATVAARSQTNPLIRYEMTGRVIYEYVMLGTGKVYHASRYKFEQAPAPMFQPFYSGTAQPGATLAVDVLGVGGEVLGSTSTIVDAGGNWAASFYDLGMTGQPHTVSIRQSYAGYTPLTGAGYNLRRYFSPAILGGAYASEHLTVENVLGNRAADVSMAALYSASAHPIALGPTFYAYEMLPMSASPQGLH